MTINQPQGIEGSFVAVLDPTLVFTGDEPQGIEGSFVAVLDPASAPPTTGAPFTLALLGVGK